MSVSKRITGSLIVIARRVVDDLIQGGRVGRVPAVVDTVLTFIEKYEHPGRHLNLRGLRSQGVLGATGPLPRLLSDKVVHGKAADTGNRSASDLDYRFVCRTFERSRF